MSLPFPRQFLHGFTQKEQKQAQEIWEELTKTAKTAPKAWVKEYLIFPPALKLQRSEEYRKKISDLLNEAIEAEKEPSKSFIHHAYTLHAVLPPNIDVYIHILSSEGVKPIDQSDVPLILSRERLIKKDHRVQKLYDIIVHIKTLEKETEDKKFAATLRTLFFNVLHSEYKLDLSKIREVSKISDYQGAWLWKKDGSQKADFEMETLEELTPKTLLQQVQCSDHAESTCEGLQTLNLSSIHKGGATRSDSKVLIEELGTRSTVPNKPLRDVLGQERSDLIETGSNRVLTEPNTHENVTHQLANYIRNTREERTVEFRLPFIYAAFAYQPAKLEKKDVLLLLPQDSSSNPIRLYFRFYTTCAEMLATSNEASDTTLNAMWKEHSPVIATDHFHLKYSKKSKRLGITLRS